MLRKWLKRFLWLGTGLVLLMVLAVVLLPFWLPWVLRPALGMAGIEFKDYERLGHGRFSLTEIRFVSETVRAEAGRVEAFLPLAWLTGRGEPEPPIDFVLVRDWRLEIEPGEPEPPAEEPAEAPSVYEVVAQIEGIVPHVITWLPRATLSDGAVALGEREVMVKSVEWRSGRLSAKVEDPVLEQEVVLAADLTGGLPYRFTGSLRPFPLEVEVDLLALDDGLAIRSGISLMGNLLTAEADFEREGYLPRRALFRSDEFLLPVEYFEIAGYQAIRGAMSLDWRAGEYELRLDGAADPLTGEERLPPVSVQLGAGGDLEHANVETLTVRSPWLSAHLSDPVRVDYQGNLLTGESVFTLEADLGAQPFVEAEGRVSGRVTLRRDGAEPTWPLAEFTLVADGLAAYEARLRQVSVKGDFEWPLLRLAETVLEGAEGSRLSGTGGWDLENQVLLDSSITGIVRGGDFAPFLPDAVEIEEVEVNLAAAGPVDQIRHRGVVAASGIATPWVKTLGAGLEWEGLGAEEINGSFSAQAGASELSAKFEARMDSEFNTEVGLKTFSLRKEGDPVLQATGPAMLTLRRGPEEGFLAGIESLHWLAPEGDGEIKADAEVVWPRRGRFALLAGGFDPAWIEDFYDLEIGVVEPGMVKVEGEWNEGPLRFAAQVDLSLALADEKPVHLKAVLAGDQEGVHLHQLRARDDRADLATASGRIPFIMYPGNTDKIRFLEDEPVSLVATTEPDAAFWKLVGDLTGFYLDEPMVRLELGGTPRQPHGHLKASLKSIQWPEREEGLPYPKLDDLGLELVFDEDRIELRRAGMAVEGERVTASASLAMGQAAWLSLLEREYPDWRQAEGRLRAEEVSLAPVARFFPTLLTPEGELNLDLRVRPGLNLTGALTVDRVATRPLMPFGSIQEGTLRVRFDGHTAEIERVSGLLGGELLTVSGTVLLPIEKPLGFDFAIRGKNVPLARQPGMIIRSDLDVRVASRPDREPLISGKLGLRESFYLAQLNLMPGGAVASPDRRPPFFSVEAEPINRWQLDLDIQGREFLNVRGGIFRGVLSAGFHLTGTLEEPRAIGSVIIEEGRFRFPFTTMSITQGVVALPRDNPFMPRLFVIAQSTTFGYDLQIEVTGTAETPVITFSSSPPLTSEQVLLMVTAGELPTDHQLFTAQQRATRFAVYLGRNLLYQITGDDSGEDRFIIRSGEHVSEQGRETFAIEFQLTDRWSVVGEYDRFDEYNAGFKLRTYTR